MQKKVDVVSKRKRLALRTSRIANKKRDSTCYLTHGNGFHDVPVCCSVEARDSLTLLVNTVFSIEYVCTLVRLFVNVLHVSCLRSWAKMSALVFLRTNSLADS